MFKRKGGGRVKGLLNNVKKNCTFLSWRLPLGVHETGPDCVCGTCDLQFVLDVSRCPDMVSVQGLSKTDVGSQLRGKIEIHEWWNHRHRIGEIIGDWWQPNHLLPRALSFPLLIKCCRYLTFSLFKVLVWAHWGLSIQFCTDILFH